MQQAGQVANVFAAGSVFQTYRAGLAKNTIMRHDGDLCVFGRYLADVGVRDAPEALSLANDPVSWAGVTWGLVQGFVAWQLQQGYAIGSVNVRLSTVRLYARMAGQAGALSTDELVLIQAVQGYSSSQGRHIDEDRSVTRVGRKKASPVVLSRQQADALKRQPDTPQGRRDAVMMALLLDHGLRVSEVIGLRVEDIDLGEGVFRFYRQKVDIWQTHQVTADSGLAMQRYIEAGDALESGPLLRASRSESTLVDSGMTDRGVSKRVQWLGVRVGAVPLSPHDCRHYWATSAAKGETAINVLRDAGGWKSADMPLRYIGAQDIANEGVRLA